MSKKPLFISIGFLLIIFLFGKYATWQIEKWQKSLPSEFPTIAPEEIPKIPQLYPTSTLPFLLPTTTLPLPESLSQPGMNQPEVSLPIEEKEFISPDGKFKIKYTSNWLRIEIGGLQTTVPEELRKNYKMEILFFAQKFGTDKSAQLIISQMFIETGKKFEEILEEMKKAVEKQGWEMEVIKSSSEEEEFNFEAIYKKGDNPPLHSAEKMLSFNLGRNQKKVFLTEIATTDRDWEYLKDEINEILNSAQLVK